MINKKPLETSYVNSFGNTIVFRTSGKGCSSCIEMLKDSKGVIGMIACPKCGSRWFEAE